LKWFDKELETSMRETKNIVTKQYTNFSWHERIETYLMTILIRTNKAFNGPIMFIFVIIAAYRVIKKILYTKYKNLRNANYLQRGSYKGKILK